MARAHAVPASNLPHPPSEFVGRQQEIAEVGRLLADSRLLTFSGPAGIGKTRLALEVARQAAPRCRDGTWIVDLAGVDDTSRLADAVRAVLPGRTHATSVTSVADLADQIAGRQMLLVLDTCEHMVHACAPFVEDLLRACPALSVLVTSREALGIRGGLNWTVGPLSLPDPDRVIAQSLHTSEAGDLFLRRARESNPRFRLTDAGASTVAEICCRLDGIPLAVELAAARVAALSPTAILDRVDDPFRFLRTTTPTVPERHRSLLDAFEWKHDLLSPPEAALLRRLSVFVGWTLTAAEEVCIGGLVERVGLVDHFTALVRKSLVVVEGGDRVRYRLLGTVRTWASSKLRADAESEILHRKHALWVLGVARRADQDAGGRQPKAALDELDAEHDNLRAALEWARANAEIEIALQLITASARFWRLRGHIDEARSWLDWAVIAAAESPPRLQAEALRAAGLLRGLLGDLGSALPLLEHSVALHAEGGDDAASLCVCNPAFLMARNPHKALAVLQERAAYCRRTGDSSGLAHLLVSIGHIHSTRGELDDARRHFNAGLQLGRGAADGEALRSALFGLTGVELVLGDLIAAEGWAAEARLSADALDDAVDAADAVGYLGQVALARGRWEKAQSLFEDSHRLARDSGLPLSIACSLYNLARLALAVGDQDARALFEHSLAVTRAAEVPVFHEIRCRVGIGSAAEAAADLDDAAHHLSGALEMAEAIDDRVPVAEALQRLSNVARRRGEFDEATALAHRSLECYHRVGGIPGIAIGLESLAGLAVDARPEVAARLLGGAERLREPQGHARARPLQARWKRERTRLRSRLGTEKFTMLWAEGARLSAEELVDYALNGRRSADRPTTGWETLTPAERDVARLVGEGLRNPDVARRLFISPRTVSTHLTHVFAKLGIDSRGALIKQLASREL